jgi:hypothetical protein
MLINIEFLYFDDEADTAELIASSLSALTDHTITSFDKPEEAIETYMKNHQIS